MGDTAAAQQNLCKWLEGSWWLKELQWPYTCSSVF